MKVSSQFNSCLPPTVGYLLWSLKYYLGGSMYYFHALTYEMTVDRWEIGGDCEIRADSTSERWVWRRSLCWSCLKTLNTKKVIFLLILTFNCLLETICFNQFTGRASMFNTKSKDFKIQTMTKFKSQLWFIKRNCEQLYTSDQL